MTREWRKRPTLLDYWPEDVESIMAIDENGTTDLEYFKKMKEKDPTEFFKASTGLSNRYDNNKWFTITGVIMNRDEFPKFRYDIVTLKDTFWPPEGKAYYKGQLRRVVFHSREIRKKESPFAVSQNDYDKFISELSLLIEKTSYIAFSASINKVKHVERYKNPFHVYYWCLNFIVERYCFWLKNNNKKGLLFLESRGKKEDHEVLKFLINLINNGNNYNGPEHFSNIVGIYFNPKWSKNHNYQKSFPLLELADLVSYPIYKYMRSQKKDLAFEIVEKKLYNYPHYDGYGLKKFP